MEGINALEGSPSLAKKLSHLAGQMMLRLAMVLTIIAIALPTIIRECLKSPAGIEEPGIWWWVKVKPASRIENWLWAIISALCLSGWFSWSQQNQVSGYYIVAGQRTNLTIKQGQIIELDMPCTVVLTGDIFEVKIRRNSNEQRWVKPPGKAAILIGKRQTRYPVRVTRAGFPISHTVEAVIYAKPN